MEDVDLGMPPEGLRGKIAIVTGVSRRQGIGAAVCRAFAQCGADLLFTHWRQYDREMPYGPDEDGPAVIERELRARGVRVESLEIDLSLPESADRVIEETVRRLGVPSILVNNATHSTRSSIDDIHAAALDAHYAVNVRGTILLSAAFIRRYPGGPGGRIINLSSGQAITPMPGELAYAATKGAIEAFTSSLAPDVAARGITVNAVDPGATDTGWMLDGLKERIAAEMRMGRVGVPEDAARLITFLASDAAAWITGQVIHSRGA